MFFVTCADSCEIRSEMVLRSTSEVTGRKRLGLEPFHGGGPTGWMEAI